MKKLLEATEASVKAAAGRTWFGVSDEGDQILLDTRDHGDVGAEEAGDADIKEAMRVLKELRKTFKPADYLTSMEVVDEWVHVSVRKLPYTAEERKEHKLQKRLRKLEEAIKTLVGQENEKLRKGVKNLRDSFAWYLSRNSHSCYSRLPSLKVSAFYGKRFLYQDRGGACFTYCDAEAALQGLHELLELLNPLIKYHGGWRLEIKGPWDKTTYNFSPPNNVIERHGEVIAQCEIYDGPR